MKRIILLGLLAALPLGCGGGGGGGAGGGPPPGGGVILTGEVGAAGGTLRVTDPQSAYAGMEVAVPPGALPATTTIQVLATEHPLIPGSMFGFELQPTGLQFGVPCEIAVPYDPAEMGDLVAEHPEDLVVLHTSDAGATEILDSSALTIADGIVRCHIQHFSTVAVGKGAWAHSRCDQESALDTHYDIRLSRNYTRHTETQYHQLLGKGTISSFWSSSRNLLLVHGINSNAAGFSDAGDLVEELSPYFDNIAIFQYRTGDRISSSGQKLAEQFTRWATPGFRCAIVAHSMGGLVARHAIETYPDAVANHVDALVTLCTPHDGVVDAKAFAGKVFWGCDQSLTDLNLGLPARDPEPNVPYFLIAGSGDILVDVESALGVDHVHRTRMRSFTTGHFDIHTSAHENGVPEQILSWLQPDEILTWVQGAGGAGTDRSAGISSVADGSLLVTGQFTGTATFGEGAETVSLSSSGGYAAFLARYNPDGSIAWARHAGGTDYTKAEALAGLPDGSCIVTGIFHGTSTFGTGPEAVVLTSTGNADAFVARYHANGSLAWARRAGGTGTTWPRGGATFIDGSCIVTGSFFGTSTFGAGAQAASVASASSYDAFIARYDADGVLVWVRRAGGAGFPTYAWGVSTWADGTCVVTGEAYGPATFGGPADPVSMPSEGTFIARYDASGSLMWVRRAGTIDHSSSGYDVSAHVDGSCVLTGYFTFDAEFGDGAQAVSISARGSEDAFVARYDAEGSMMWVRRAGGATGTAGGLGAATLPDGSTVVAGGFSGLVAFGDGEDAATLESSGGSDTFIARYLSDGTLAWARRAGGNANVDIGSISTWANGSCCVAGHFSGTAEFAEGTTPTPLVSAGGSDVFLVRLGPDGSP